MATYDPGEQVLDAARRCLLRRTGRKVTLAQIAREAGVSRPTVYRRWADVNEVIRSLLTREVVQIVQSSLGPNGFDGSSLDDIVARIVLGVEALRSSELIEMLWREQSQLMAPYVLGRLGASQLTALDLIADGLRRAQDRGVIRAGDINHIASVVLLICQTAVSSALIIDATLGDAWKPEVYRLLYSYLDPAAGPTTIPDLSRG